MNQQPETSTITVDRDPGYAPCSYLICRVRNTMAGKDWDTRDEENTVLVQTDWDFPGVASTFGWVPCFCNETDGTVDCRHKTALEMITSAAAYLDTLCGTNGPERYAADPGYFA